MQLADYKTKKITYFWCYKLHCILVFWDRFVPILCVWVFYCRRLLLVVTGTNVTGDTRHCTQGTRGEISDLSLMSGSGAVVALCAVHQQTGKLHTYTSCVCVKKGAALHIPVKTFRDSNHSKKRGAVRSLPWPLWAVSMCWVTGYLGKNRHTHYIVIT